MNQLDKILKEKWNMLIDNECKLFHSRPSSEIIHRKSFNKFMISLFERENDKTQLDQAEELYKKVLTNISNINLSEFNGNPAYDLTIFFGEPFIVVFWGEELGTIKLDINGIETFVLVVGSSVFTHNKNNDLYEFWVDNEAYIIHELIHLNDYKRVNKIPKSDLNNATAYYNNPLEFNAYYLEIAHTLYNDFKYSKNISNTDRKDFLEYAWNHISKMLPNIKQNLSKEMLFKWNKRLYQLYDELRKEFND